MTRAFDFTRLSLQDALDLAILVEEEAQERYLELASQMEIHHTGGAAAFFRFMAENEEKHGAELRARRLEMFADAARRVDRSMLWDVEAPDYDEARAFMSAHRAMEVGLRAEVKAHAYFVAALDHVHDKEVRRLFEELRDEEVEHQRLVREQLAKLPPEPAADDQDWGDEPVAQ
jgi:erythrin-vacuolar iron transport family protein